MKVPFLALGLVALGVYTVAGAAAPSPLLAQTPRASWDSPLRSGHIDARIWLENERDYFRRGDRMRVSFRTNRDAHVAVVHIDTQGRVEFLFPFGPREDDYVRGDRTYSVPGNGAANGWVLRDGPGIGYFFVVASRSPLDYRYFADRFGRHWDLSHVGYRVHGDPFFIQRRLAEMLLPSWSEGAYAMDAYSYHVDGRHRYPSYACGGGYGDYDGWQWDPYYGSCDRVDVLLRQHPDYYDTRRYRGDRAVYLRERVRVAPRHRFKEAPTRLVPVPHSSRSSGEREEVREAPMPRWRERPEPAEPRARSRPAERPQEVRPEPARPAPRERPKLERRPREQGGPPTPDRPSRPEPPSNDVPSSREGSSSGGARSGLRPGG